MTAWLKRWWLTREIHDHIASYHWNHWRSWDAEDG